MPLEELRVHSTSLGDGRAPGWLPVPPSGLAKWGHPSVDRSAMLAVVSPGSWCNNHMTALASFLALWPWALSKALTPGITLKGPARSGTRPGACVGLEWVGLEEARVTLE